MSDSSHRLTPEQVSLILARAAEIDAQGESMTVDALREIAQEAGLDPAATGRAMDEVLRAPGVALESRASSRAGIVRSSAAAGGVGVGLGVLAAAVPASGLAALGLGVAYLFGALGWGEDAPGRWSFLRTNTLLWSGFVLGAVAVAGNTFLEAIGLAVVLGVLLTAFGVIRAVIGMGSHGEAKGLPSGAPD